jgi:tripartite-type tricarboxylate transporter receptor subunit TctC
MTSTPACLIAHSRARRRQPGSCAYRGTTPALNALVGGQVQVYFGTGSASIEDIKSGRLRALAVTDRDALRGSAQHTHHRRFRARLRGYLGVWVGAPRNTPTEIVDRLNKRINASFADPKIKAQLC